MTDINPPQTLTATHHAMLFALMARAVVRDTAEKSGEMVMRKAVRAYGEQRGRRMALRARANGHALSMANFLAYGHPQCDFVFQDANLTFRNYIVTAYRKLIRPGKTCRMSWDYHSGHLYKTVGEVVVKELGHNGQTAIESALTAFAAHYDESAAKTVASFGEVDFNILPG